jgi:two-component system, NarL family, capsular synthesis sensor histidine kinase RcsC
MPNEPRVLIIEDHEALRAMLFTVLRHQPLSVDTVGSAQAALESVLNCDYALILIDMDLSGGTAETFLSEYRSLRPEAPSFIIAVRDPGKSSFIDPASVSAILNKPLEIDTLADVVRECAAVVPAPAEPRDCPPAESEIRAGMDGGSYLAN